jgi:ketosteroid isomerase-like protein
MSAIAVSQRYFDAWNRHDAAAIVATFAPDGVYSDPTSGGPLTGDAIGAYAAGLWAALPDLSFELMSAGEPGEDMVPADGACAGRTPRRSWDFRLPAGQFRWKEPTSFALPKERYSR